MPFSAGSGLKHSFSCLSILAKANMLKQLKLCFRPGSACAGATERAFCKGRRPSEKEFQTAYVPCVRLRCANRTYGGLYLHSMHAVKRRNRTHEIHNLHKTHRPSCVNAPACAGATERAFCKGRRKRVSDGLRAAQLRWRFEHFGESQHAQTTEAVLQAGLCLRRSDGKGILCRSDGRRPSEKEFQTAYVPCVRLRCANRTYGGLYLHRYARRETA